MGKKQHLPLPEPLRYLEPFVNRLARLPPDRLNEDVDASGLERALRNRVKHLGEGAAADALDRDRQHLQQWLEASAPPDHPAYWLLGFISFPDLAEQLGRLPEPPPRVPTMTFDPPEGWKVKVVPFRLDLKKGKLIAVIMAIADEFSFRQRQRDLEHSPTPQPDSPLKAAYEVTTVRFGDVSGDKYVVRQTAPGPWKRVDYLLRVRDGFVSVTLDAMGADFDEGPFESKLHTVRLVPPASLQD